MTPDEWYDSFHDRTLRYAGRVLSRDRPIVIELDAEYGARYDGQVAAIVAANLLSRMSPRVIFDFPSVSIVKPLPWAQASLSEFVLSAARAADPHGAFLCRQREEGDFVFHLGRRSPIAAVHGSGWGAFAGPGQSCIPDSNTNNPVGPALAVITAAARIFASNLAPLDLAVAFDGFTWSDGPPNVDAPLPTNVDLGQLWSIGAGSVGTAALYFLTLATRQFSSVVFDMDEVKVTNLDRSPIFTAEDAFENRLKAQAAETYLRNVGVQNVSFENKPLDLSVRWRDRQENIPDVVIGAANERNVRYLIEQSFPPLQIYATTGRNWNITGFRHIPLVDPCSCCVFPPGTPMAATICAEGSVRDPVTHEDVDAALPFLSFGAGLFTAAEILKAQMPHYPHSPNRIFFSASLNSAPHFTHAPMARRSNCVCASRSEPVHRRMIETTKYARLSLADASI